MMRLALAQGKSLREIEAMPADELMEWVAYDAIEGIPQPWRQTGVIAAATVNLWRGKGKKPLKPEQFMPIRHVTRSARLPQKELRRRLEMVLGRPPRAAKAAAAKSGR
jgi:hypothetical protein